MIFKMTFFFVACLILAGIWGVFIEPRHIKVEKISLKIENLPSSFKNLKILHLSDFHSKKFGPKEKKILKILNQLNPDLIFITGDIVGRRTRDFESCQKFWQELSKNYDGRIFGVYGNHDHWNKKFRDLNVFLEESKIEILNNESRKIERDGEFIYPHTKRGQGTEGARTDEVSPRYGVGVYLIGVDDPHLEYDDIERAMEGTESNSFKILLAHSPEIFRKVKEKDIDLILVGHTHGGQINIPILSDLILPLRYDKKYKNGLFKENSKYLYVNRGTGESLLPIRINSFPEVTLIEFK